MPSLFLIRHGTTFSPGDVLRRIGARTDLCLSPEGVDEAMRLGTFLRDRCVTPTAIFSSTLVRARNTARIVAETLSFADEVLIDNSFNEIDYGPDEGLPEEQVVARIGHDALSLWNKCGVPPQGWNVNVSQIKESWRKFGEKVTKKTFGSQVIVVTSNGIARFAPSLLEDFESFSTTHRLKLSTGSFSHFEVDPRGRWQCRQWNIKPS
jgi:2,3-bisphosphoglycerate-dependent phosphoglycerate mutase